MKSKHLLLTLLLALLVPWAANAQETVTIGNGTGTTYMVPFNSLYGYSFTEQIFLASEVGMDGDITSISFDLGQSYSTEQTNTIALYMKNVTRETFADNTDYEPVTEDDLVYSGSWTIPANTTGWLTITLDTPFEYDGVSNLMIAMHESTYGYSTRYFLYTSVSNSGISYYSDSNNPDPYNLGSYSGSKVLRSNRSNIQLVIEPATDCPKPSQLAANDITAHTAVLTWEGPSPYYYWQYKKATSTDWENAGTVGEKTYTMTNLDPETEYIFSVASDCDPEVSGYREITFTTPESCPMPTNFTVNFNGGNTAEVTWTGTADNYNLDLNGTVIENVTSPYGLTALELSTEYTVMVQANCGDGELSNWTDPISFTTSACEEPIVIQYTLNDSWSDGWNGNAIQIVEGCGNIIETLTLESGSSATGTLYLCGEYFEFVWVKGSYPGETSWTFTQDGTTLFSGSGNDNMTTGDKLYTLGEETCARPANLTKSNVTNHSATLTWTGAEGQNNWEIKYNVGEDFDPETEGTLVEDEIDTPTYTFDKTLEAATHYYMYVRANCGDDDHSCWVSIGFTTATAAPYPTNVNISQVTPESAVVAWTAPTGDFLESYDIFYRMNIDSEPTEEEEPQYTGIQSTSYVMHYDNTDANFCYVYVRANHGTDGLSEWSYVASFQVPEDCAKPYNLTAYDPTPNTVTLNWIEGAEWQSTWVVAYSTIEGFDPDNTEGVVFVNAYGYGVPPFTVTGLDSETTYYFRVKGNCGTYGASEWNQYEVSATTLANCPVPTDLAVTVNQNIADLTWTGYSDSYTVQYRPAANFNAIFSEDFEGYLSSDWQFVNCASGTGISANSSFAHSGNQAFVFVYNTNPPQRLISPEIVGITDDMTLEFYYRNTSSNYPETFQVGFSSTDIEIESFTFGEEYTAQDQQWHLYSETIPAGTKYICWQLNSYDMLRLCIDDVQVGYEVPAGDWITYNTTTEEAITLVLDYGTTFDVRVKANCSDPEEYSEYITFSTNPLKTFITEGAWDNADNWTPAGVPTIEDNISIVAAATINAGVVAKANIITIDGGSLTIEDGGQLVNNNLNSYGNYIPATVKKNIVGYGDATIDGYYLIAHPLANACVPTEANGLLSGAYDLYDWNPAATQGQEWRNFKTGSFMFEDLSAKYGYLYANQDDVTLNFTGNVRSSKNREAVSFSAYNYSSHEFGRWALLGNPFTCNAYLVDNNGNPLPYIKMNEAGNGFEVVAEGTPITPTMGIFYESEFTGLQTVYFTREATDSKAGELNLVLTEGRGVIDNAIIRFGEGQQMSKFSFRENSSKIYMPVDNTDYAIVNAGNVGEMPVSFKAENNGTYTLNFNTKEVSFSYLHLIDNMTGADVNLLETPYYTFNAQTTDYASRFKLVFATGNSIDGDSFGFINGTGNLSIFGIDGEATVQVMDILGHVISSDTFSGSYEQKLNVAPGVYMIRLIQGNDVKVQKMIVK